jgi:hypothetical protein
MKNFLLIVGTLSTFILLGACDLEPGEDDVLSSGSEIDWPGTSGNDYVFQIKNETSVDLIGFKGSLSKDRIIGGFKPNETVKVKKNPAVFGTTAGDFALVFITKDQYTNAGSSLDTQVPYTRVWAFYSPNQDAPDNSIIRISSKLGGDCKLVVQNSSNRNVELRLNGVNGEVLGYAPANSNYTNIYVVAGPLVIYPVFKKYNPTNDQIMTIYPVGDNGPWSDSISLGLQPNGSDKTKEYNAATITGTTNFSVGSAYLIVTNGSAADVCIYEGSGPAAQTLKTDTGYANIPNSSNLKKTFTFPMGNVSGSQKFSPSIPAPELYVGGPNSQNPLHLNLKTNLHDDDFANDGKFMDSHVYQVTIGGNLNVGGLTATAIEWTKQILTIDDFANN